MEVILILGLLMFWVASGLAVAVVIGGAVRLRDHARAVPSGAERPEEVLHVVV
jgi:hypothetical protein